MAALLTILAGLLPALLPKLGLNTSLDALITAAVNGVQAIFTGLKSGTPVDATLTALEAALTALQADTPLNPNVLSDVAEGIRDLQAGILAYKAAQVVTDPSTLTPIPEVS